jgi:NAD(P)-dependent dehydrogenase (short-subunit alcohol dehydrogenase family)
VTGASSGIGQAIAERLAATVHARRARGAPARPSLSARGRRSSIEADGGRARVEPMDVARPTATSRASAPSTPSSAASIS